MCQLSYISFNNKAMNSVYLLNQIRINASAGHRDGCGFFVPETGIWKTDLPADIISNLGRIIRGNISGKSPIISHVRRATFTNNVKTKSIDKSHPFQTDKLIFAHNGHLDLKDDKIKNPDLNDKIDSEIFLYYLDKAFTGDNLYTALAETMKLFTGKFAFLIYDRINKKYYVVRGESATLFYVVYNGGLVINTERESLLRGLSDFVNDLQLIPAIFERKAYDPPDIVISDIKEIPPETVFEINGLELIKLGEIKENKKVWESVWNSEAARGFNSKGFLNTPKGVGYVGGAENSNAEKILNFLREYDIDLLYLDRMCSVLFGKGLLECEDDDITCLVDDVLNFVVKNTKKHYIREWRKLRKKASELSPIELNVKTGLSFPYMFDELANLRQAYVDISLTEGKN